MQTTTQIPTPAATTASGAQTSLSPLVEAVPMTRSCGREFHIRYIEDLPKLFDEVLKKGVRLHVKIDPETFSRQERKEIATLIRAMILRDGDRATDIAQRFQLAARPSTNTTPRRVSSLEQKYGVCFRKVIEQLFQSARKNIPDTRRIEVVRRVVLHDKPVGSESVTDNNLARRVVDKVADRSGALRELHLPYIHVVGPTGSDQRVSNLANQIKQELANRENAQLLATPLRWVGGAWRFASSWLTTKLQAS